MKMVSQLTRQALQRHRLISAGTISTPSVPSVPTPQTASPQPTGFSLVHPLYTRSAPAEPALSPANAAPIRPQPAPPRPRTIYQQLMTSHDRMTERHLKRT